MDSPDTNKQLDQQYHAWYSDKQREIRLASKTNDNHRIEPGSIYWLDQDGNKVEVTMVSKKYDHGCNVEFIDDLQYRGIVVTYSGICNRL